MIPKKIHYCWFGGNPKPASVKKCIQSWRTFCPDYEIIEWNESNFDPQMNGYTKKCLNEKKYAFLSDYARLYIVEKYGGIYFDTDVELIKNIDHLLTENAFFCFETLDKVASGLGFGSAAHGNAVEQMLREYDILLDGKSDVIGCPELNTKALLRLGLKPNGSVQKVSDAIILSSDYMNPFDSVTGTVHQTENTVSIHWYDASWLKPTRRFRVRIMRVLRKIFGRNFLNRNR